MVEMIRMKTIYFIFSLLLMSSCIEPIDFETGEEPRRLVVEGLVTNNSYVDRQSFPGPAERFYVSLSWTREVINEYNETISDANVQLISSDGDIIQYLWNPETQRYEIPFDNFRVISGVKYHLEIQLASGETYVSEEDELYDSPQISQLSAFNETRIKEIQVRDQTSIVEQRGVRLAVSLPEHNDNKTYYYRWKVVPGWVFESSMLNTGNPNKTCYITNKFYFQKINVREDRAGGYDETLFFLETDDNDRVEYDFTALIIQYSLSPDAYAFWEELALQQQSGGGIFDPPPFPLTSNIRNINDPEEKVSGYFMVAHESVKRWFINMSELPYNLTFPDPCEPVPGVPFIPPRGCSNCLDYAGGHTSITNQKPSWWREY